VIVSHTEAGDHAAGQPPAAVAGPPDPDNDQRQARPRQQRIRCRVSKMSPSATAELTGGQPSTTPIPLYYRLKTLLTEEILSGVYETDGRLPTEQELCEGSA
jgi:hypothetical protein